MRATLPGLVVAYIPMLALAQNGAQDMLNERARTMQALSQASHPDPKQEPLADFRTDDDPTTGADVQDHLPSPEARKAFGKAERASKKKHREEAIAAFREALRLDPDYYEAANNLGIELEANGDREKAIATFQKLTASDPDRILAFNNLARLLCESHRFQEAELISRKAVKLHPYSFKANLLLGQALVQSGNWTPEAKRDLEYASVKHPEAQIWLERWPSH